MAGVFRSTTATLNAQQAGQQPPPGDRIADFSFQSEPIAQMIVYAWTDTNFRNQLLNNVTFSKQAFADRGVYLKAPVVITEDQYNNNYIQQDPDGVIFVLPNPPRTVTPPQGGSLLETAKLLMACTPNGI